MNNPEHLAPLSRENTVRGRVEHFCRIASITPQQAFQSAMPELSRADIQALLNRLNTLDILSETAAHSIAKYFRVGVADIDPEIAEDIRSRLVYLAGPITAKAGSLETFHMAQKYLESVGYYVLNPSAASNTLPEPALTRQNFMDFGLTMLRMCRCIALLPGWQDSTGCQMEKAYAKANGYTVLYIYPEDLNSFNEKTGISPNTANKEPITGLSGLSSFNITLRFGGDPSGGAVSVNYNDGSNPEVYPVSSIADIKDVVAEAIETGLSGEYDNTGDDFFEPEAAPDETPYEPDDSVDDDVNF